MGLGDLLRQAEAYVGEVSGSEDDGSPDNDCEADSEESRPLIPLRQDSSLSIWQQSERSSQVPLRIPRD